MTKSSNPFSDLADRAAFYGIPMEQLTEFLPVAVRYIDLRKSYKTCRGACEVLSVSDENWQDALEDIFQDTQDDRI